MTPLPHFISRDTRSECTWKGVRVLVEWSDDAGDWVCDVRDSNGKSIDTFRSILRELAKENTNG